MEYSYKNNKNTTLKIQIVYYVLRIKYGYQISIKKIIICQKNTAKV